MHISKTRKLILIIVLLVISSYASAYVTKTFKVPMRDGTKLATDVYLPSDHGTMPVIMIRTPYGRKGQQRFAAAAIRNSYGCVIQDTRGRFDSEGIDYPVFVHDGWGEHKDGYDTVEWIAAQKFSNGKVASFGISAMGITANMTAPTQPPHLVCQFVSVAFSSMYHQSTYQGGAFRKALVENWLKGNKFHPQSLEIIRDHPDYDDYWREINPEEVMHRVNVPTMFVGGWYDIFSKGTLNGFGIVQYNGSGRARGNCRLVMEAFGHGTSDEHTVPNPKSPPSANVFRWFDVWMKNDGKDAGKIPIVHYYVMGDPEDKHTPGNEWRTSEDWPISAKIKPMYFHADGRLSENPQKNENVSVAYKYDPDNPVPTIGGANLTIKKGPRDQRPIGFRDDIITFESEKLKKYLQVTGNVKVKLWASSSATDTDFTAKLSDIYPDGRKMIVLDGIIRGSHRDSMEESEALIPGKVYEFEIDLWSTALVFSPGHKICVDISSSNSPRFEPNPNVYKPSETDDEKIVATNRIFLDAEHPSHILLPVVENRR